MDAMSVLFQNDSNVLALDYPQRHGKGHFKQIENRKRANSFTYGTSTEF
jgi:hypothetical protein